MVDGVNEVDEIDEVGKVDEVNGVGDSYAAPPGSAGRRKQRSSKRCAPSTTDSHMAQVAPRDMCGRKPW